MKGILKLSTLALSAAMVAGLSTPVFAAGANVGTTSTATITVKDSNNNVVATTASTTDVKKVYLADGTENTGDRTVFNITLANGAVKKLNVSASDDATVKWAYDSDRKTTQSGDAEESVSISDDGTVTVAKDAVDNQSGQSYYLLGYIDGTEEEDGSLDNTSYITLKITVEAPTSVDLEYTNADNYYTASDADDAGDEWYTAISTTTADLYETQHSSTELSSSENKEVNHIATGDSATFNYAVNTASKTDGDDSDYNTLVKFKSYFPDDVTSASAFIKATANDGESTGTVSVVGTPSENGLAYFIPTLTYKNGSSASNTVVTGTRDDNALYVIGDATSQENVYRVYNPNNGEHFYTNSAKEANALVEVGWTLESVAWVAPTTSATPVYRLYNPNVGEHHYTTSTKERDALVAAGWTDENVAFYSASEEYTKVYREYNQNETAFNHNYTTSVAEHSNLVSLGWRAEGVAFYEFSYVLPDEYPATAAGYAQAATDAVEEALE